MPSAGPSSPIPALLTSMSRPPQASTTRPTEFSATPRSDTSATSATAVPPARSILAVASTAAEGSRSRIATRAPCPASASAIARPRPLPAPVIRARSPCRSKRFEITVLCIPGRVCGTHRTGKDGQLDWRGFRLAEHRPVGLPTRRWNRGSTLPGVTNHA